MNSNTFIRVQVWGKKNYFFEFKGLFAMRHIMRLVYSKSITDYNSIYRQLYEMFEILRPQNFA